MIAFQFSNCGRWVNSGLTNSYVHSVAISPNYAADNTVFAGTNGGGIFSYTFSADTTAPTTNALPAGGTYASAQSVSLICYDGSGSGCDKIYYTADGSTPTTSSPVYSRSINISTTTTLKFFAIDLAGNQENVKSETYNISPIIHLAPNGGEIIPSGSTYNIQWSASSNAVKFDLKYSPNNGSTWSTIASNVTGTSYNWTVPVPWNNKRKCLIKVIGYDSSGMKVGEDRSDSTFTIEVVKLTSPDGGEVLTSGSPYTIRWRTNATKRPVQYEKFFYSTDGGTTWKFIALRLYNLGTNYWTVPSAPPVDGIKTRCKVKVVLKAASGRTVGTDISDNFFTIQP